MRILWQLCVLLILLNVHKLFGQEFEITYGKPGFELSKEGIDTTDITKIKSLIDGESRYMSLLASVFLAERGISDIAPKIKERYRQEMKDPLPPFDYLIALYLLKDSEAPRYLSEFVDTILTRHRRGQHADPSQMYSALEMMYNLGDYSRFPLIDSLSQNLETILWKPGHVQVVVAFGKRPEYRARVFELLKKFLTYPDRSIRINTVIGLRQFLDISETRTLLRGVALNDTDGTIINEAIKYLYVIYKDPEVINLCEQIAKTTRDFSVFGDAVDWLYMVIATPPALKALQRIRDARTEEEYLKLVTTWITAFRPRTPPDTVPVSVMLDTLVSFKHQVAALGWLGDKNFVKELDNHLDNAKRHLTRRDSLNTAQQVRLFQEKVHREHERTKQKQQRGVPRDPRFVTIEAWKFLYHHAGYILERLPRERKPK
jgi:hypothetical protein